MISWGMDRTSRYYNNPIGGIYIKPRESRHSALFLPMEGSHGIRALSVRHTQDNMSWAGNAPGHVTHSQKIPPKKQQHADS